MPGPEPGSLDKEFALAFSMGELPTILINLGHGRERPCPREFWRVGGHLKAAFRGEVVFAGIDDDEPCSAAIKTVDLANWFGISPELELPKAGSKPPISQADLLGWWLDEYLKKHPDPDKRPKVPEQLEAAKARFSDHAPPTAGQMQKLRAHPKTPSEWRYAGRRPKLD